MTRVTVNRENRETTDAYERYARSVSARDVLGAWALALAVFLGLAVSSLVQDAFSDRSIGVTAPQTAFGPGEIRHGVEVDNFSVSRRLVSQFAAQ